MKQYINKAAIMAEVKSRIKESEKLANVAADNNLSNTLQANELLIRQYKSLLNFIDTIEVKDVDLETDIEKEYIEHNIDIFNRKFPNLPKLNGQYLHDYKNFLNTCKQIFKFHYWNNHPTQEILFEKLSLLWSTWGAQHLKNLFEINSEGLQKMDVEVKEVDLEKEIKDYFDSQPIITRSKGVDYRLIPTGVDIARHFFELGIKAHKGE